MNIEFSKDDAVKILHYGFVNDGLTMLGYASVEIDWDVKENVTNYKVMKGSGLYFEDILVKILHEGYPITFKDFEEDEHINLSLDKALERFNALEASKKLQLAKILDEDDTSCDAYDASNALQYALYGDVIFG